MPPAEPSPAERRPRGTTEPFTHDGWSGELSVACLPRGLADALARLTDPGQSRETLHWGRNYLYSTVLDTTAGEIEVVVKQFRNQSLAARLRRRLGGSKAWRSWRGAHALVAAGVPTPAPVAWIESSRPDGPSVYASRRVAGSFEARYLIRALNAGRHREEFPQVDVEAFFSRLGAELRRMHDAGIWHRDVSIGNILVVAGAGRPELYLIDLNRARLGRRLGSWRRSRDLCRLRLLRARDRRRLLTAYWGPAARAMAWKRALYGAMFHGFLFKNWLKAALRRPLRVGRGLHRARRPHLHIPAAERGAGVRDRVVWDRLSDQPHQHAGRLERLGVRLADTGDHARSLGAALAAAPRVWRRFRQLRGGLYAAPVRWQGLGVAVRPLAGDPEGEALLGELTALGVRRLLLRLHPWQERHDAEQTLARRLAEAGYDLAFTLPQSRELVRDPARWRAAVAELAERFRPFGSSFQVGQAVNRSKWGVWRYGEYLALAAMACEELRRHPGTEVLGPAVIDFEPHATAAVLNRPHPGVRFDAVASLLYVDRRGAPECRQLGLDLVGKLLLISAIAATGRNAAARSWITEFNWPLWEGPHAPAGRDVAVDEQTQADYLARYYLLALGSGVVERAYWWQLVARGYGLVDPRDDGLRRRPAFHALATLAREVEGSRFLGPLPAPPAARLYQFERGGGGRLVAGWSTGAAIAARLPAPAAAAVSRDGEPLAADGCEVTLTASPRYFRIA